MALPTIAVSDRKVVLLSGFYKIPAERKSSPETVIIRDEAKLRVSIKDDNDAVAFGYVAGKWIGVA